MDISAIKSTIENGNSVLGIEMGSTRIKAVLIDEKHNPIASGSHGWENRRAQRRTHPASKPLRPWSPWCEADPRSARRDPQLPNHPQIAN